MRVIAKQLSHPFFELTHLRPTGKNQVPRRTMLTQAWSSGENRHTSGTAWLTSALMYSVSLLFPLTRDHFPSGYRTSWYLKPYLYANHAILLSRMNTRTRKCRPCKSANRPIDFADASLLAIAERKQLKTIISIDSDFLIYQTAHDQPLENILNRKK